MAKEDQTQDMSVDQAALARGDKMRKFVTPVNVTVNGFVRAAGSEVTLSEDEADRIEALHGVNTDPASTAAVTDNSIANLNKNLEQQQLVDKAAKAREAKDKK